MMKILEYLELNDNKNALYHTVGIKQSFTQLNIYLCKKKKKRLKLNTVSIKPNKLEKSTIK